MSLIFSLFNFILYSFWWLTCGYKSHIHTHIHHTYILLLIYLRTKCTALWKRNHTTTGIYRNNRNWCLSACYLWYFIRRASLRSHKWAKENWLKVNRSRLVTRRTFQRFRRTPWMPKLRASTILFVRGLLWTLVTCFVLFSRYLVFKVKPVYVFFSL